MIKETDLAYIAGFVDGEGCVGYQSKRKKYPWITITNTDEAT